MLIVGLSRDQDVGFVLRLLASLVLQTSPAAEDNGRLIEGKHSLI